MGFPKFKSRRGSRASFACPQGCKVDLEKGLLSIPKCRGIKTVFSRVFAGTIKTITISRSKGGRYFASILVDDGRELPAKAAVQPETAVGIDVGIKHFATLSSGEKIENPKYLRQSQARLKVLQRRLSHKQKGSSNRFKARLRVAKLHEHIANQRQDFLHQVSTRLIRENQTVIVEDLGALWAGGEYAEEPVFGPCDFGLRLGEVQRVLALQVRVVWPQLGGDWPLFAQQQEV